jgi:ketosteroid isomerase-like protein
MLRRLALLLITFVAAPAGVRAEPAPPEVAAELRTITQALLDAVAPGRADVWERYLHPDLIHVDENGTVRSRDQLLAEIRPLPAGLVGGLRVDRFQASLHGDTAVAVHDDQEQLDYHGQRLRSRFRSLDVWRRTPDGWKLVAQQVSAVLRDPPSIALGEDELCAYSGTYRLTDEVRTTLRCEGGALVAERDDRPAVRYLPELRDLFFVPGQPRSRRVFLRDGSGRITGFADRREGEDVVWRRAE